VNLLELRQACRRLLIRLADQADGETAFVTFSVGGNTLKLITENASEGSRTTINPSGRVQVPRTVFCCLVKALRYHRGSTIDFECSPGTITISGRTQIRHRGISVREGVGIPPTAR